MQKYRVSPVVGQGCKSVIVGGESPDQCMLLGRLAEVGPNKDVWLDTGKEHVIGIMGKRGSGKTHTLGVVLEGLTATDTQLTLAQRSVEKAVLVFDTLNLFQWIGVPLETATGKVARQQLDRARSWNLPVAPIHTRLWHLAGSDPVTRDSSPFMVRVADMLPQDWGFLLDVDVMMDPMGQLLMAGVDKVKTTGWQAGSVHKSPVTNYTIRDLVACIGEDSEITHDFSPETRRAVRQRLLSFEHVGLFSNDGTDLTELVGAGHASVLLLGRCPEDLRTVVTFLVMRKLLEQRSITSEKTKDSLITGKKELVEGAKGIPPTWVLIDEAQNIIPSNTASLANRELTRFVREGRNFGLSMVISTQQPQAIDPKVMSQVDTLLVHTLTVQNDILYIMNNLKSSHPETITLGRQALKLQDAIRELETGQCLISSVDSPRALFAEIRPRVTPHGGFEA